MKQDHGEARVWMCPRCEYMPPQFHLMYLPKYGDMYAQCISCENIAPLAMMREKMGRQLITVIG